MIVNLVTEFGLERNRLLYPACACAHGVNSIIGASLSEPHSLVARITRKLSVCLSWTGTALDLMFLALTILTFDAAAHN